MGFLGTLKGKITVAVAIVLIIIAVVLCVFFLGNREESYRSISVSEIYGKVTAENNGKSYDAYRNMMLRDGYTLITDSDSYTRMVLDDDKYIKLEEKSRALFEALGSAGNTAIRLIEGTITNELTKPLSEEESYVINTPNSVLAVRGTFFVVRTGKDENGNDITHIFTYGGTVVCKRILPDGTVVDEEVVIEAGYKTTVKMYPDETIYVIERNDEGYINVEPINMSEIPDSHLIDIYNASLGGHEMFLSEEEIRAEMNRRGIDENGKAVTTAEAVETSEETSTTTSVTSTEATTESITTVPKEITTVTTTSSSAPPETSAITSAPVILSEVTTVQSSATEEIIEATSSSSEETELVTTAEEATEVTTIEEATTASETTEVTTIEEATTASETTEITTAEETTSASETTTEEITTIPQTRPTYIFNWQSTSVTQVTTTEHICVFEDYITVVGATCTTNEILEGTCVCGKTNRVEVEDTMLPHDFVYTVKSEATCTSNEIHEGVCTCGAVETVEIEDSMLSHTYTYVVQSEATCTENEVKLGTCTCGATEAVETEGSAKGHTEVTETAAPTLATEGYNRTVCSVCNEIISEQITEKLSSLDASGGEITITETGYIQGDAEEETAYTGEYTITSSADSSGTINVTGGSHNIIIDGGSNSYNLTVSDGAEAALSGTGYLGIISCNGNMTISGNITATEYTGIGNAEIIGGNAVFSTINNNGVMTVSDGVLKTDGTSFYAMTLMGTFIVNGGECNISGTGEGLNIWSGSVTVNGGKLICNGSGDLGYHGIRNDNGGVFTMNGGSVECDRLALAENCFIINGGSLYIGISDIHYSIVNGLGEELMCNVYDSYEDYTAAVADTDYALTKSDCASDGKYYVWLPATT